MYVYALRHGGATLNTVREGCLAQRAVVRLERPVEPLPLVFGFKQCGLQFIAAERKQGLLSCFLPLLLLFRRFLLFLGLIFGNLVFALLHDIVGKTVDVCKDLIRCYQAWEYGRNDPCLCSDLKSLSC